MTTSSTTGWQTYLDDNKPRFLEELLDFLRIPSVSSLPEHIPDVQTAAEWVANRIGQAGLENIQILSTGDTNETPTAHPVVYGDWLHAEGKPTIMIYGHFDTQPVDPIELWDSPPFEPVIKDGLVYARGASDDKGNMFAPILAIEALMQSEGTLPVNLKVFFEGQEEIGSPQIPPFVEQHADLFACDLVVSADGGQFGEDQPSVLISLKGLAGVEIDLTGPSHDVHSGMYGGAIQNPIHALSQILASMRSVDGKILVEGFFDNVLPLSDEDRAKIAEIPHDEDDYKAKLSIDDVYGEPGYTTNERAWARPTLEVNGIWGGFQGEGIKTVLPSEAHAKITCRLVANQNPTRIAELLVAHVEKHTPPGVNVTVTPFASSADPYLIPADHPGNQAVRNVHLSLYGKEPFQIRVGGSIPVCGLFQKHLGVYTVNFGFGLNDERMHSPNEFFRLSSFERGQKGYCMLLHELGETDLG